MIGFIVAILNVFSSIFIGIYFVIGTVFGYTIIAADMQAYKDICVTVAKLRNCDPADVICKESIFYYMKDFFRHVFLWPFILYRINHLPKKPKSKRMNSEWYTPNGKYDYDLYDILFNDPKI